MSLLLRLAGALSGALLLGSLARGQSLLFTRVGTPPGGYFGYAVATADLDGDGCDDLVVGESEFGASEGRVLAYSGRTGALMGSIQSGVPGAQLGASLAIMPDASGTGVLGILAGEPGANSIVLLAPNLLGFYFFNSIQVPGAQYGAAVAVIDDVNGDGRRDIVVGAPGASQYSVCSGVNGSIFYTNYEPAGVSQYGAAVAVAGDYNGDGIREFVVGAPYWDETALGRVDCGRVIVVDPVNGFPLFFVPGDVSFAYLGGAVAGLGDLNGDGVREFAAGAGGTMSGGQRIGLVRVWSGASFAKLRDSLGSATNNLGWSLSALGDINRDGVDDLVTGAPYESPTNGSATLISGVDGTFLYVFAGPASGGRFGRALAGGDFNADGVADVVIGDPLDSLGVGSVSVYLGCPAFSTSYGTGWPGKLGIPSLTATQKPAIGGTLALSITNSVGTTTLGLLFLGGAPANVTVHSGATFLVTPAFRIVLAIPAAGLSVSSPIDGDPALCGLHLYLQALELDALAVGNLSYTAGLDVTFGYDL